MTQTTLKKNPTTLYSDSTMSRFSIPLTQLITLILHIPKATICNVITTETVRIINSQFFLLSKKFIIKKKLIPRKGKRGLTHLNEHLCNYNHHFKSMNENFIFKYCHPLMSLLKLNRALEKKRGGGG